MFGRNKVAMVVAEFFGTFCLAGVILAMLGRTSFPFFQAAAAGATFGLMLLILGAVSGAHINPALTVAFWSVRKLQTTKAVVFIAAQLLGGLAAWRMSEYLLGTPIKSIAGDEFIWRILIAEALGAFVFAFGVAAAVYQGYRGLRLAVTAGTSLSVGMILATFAGNGLINPAVAITVQSWSIAYAVGPVVGAVLGMNLYGWLLGSGPSSSRFAVAKGTRQNKKSVKSTTKKRT